MTCVLLAAALYNLVWGGFIVLFPLTSFRWAGLAEPNYPAIWQCLGMVIGVYGIGYAIAAVDPYRHWPIVLVGLLGKLFGPLGFLFSDLPWVAGLMLLANDLVWWPPFMLILRGAWQHALRDEGPVLPVAEALAGARTQTGATLAELSRRSPLLLVFFRHLG
jgi:hypothetical protein